METAEMRFPTTIIGYRMTGHKRCEDITEQRGITDINTITKEPSK
jgi:hypothetical protein